VPADGLELACRSPRGPQLAEDRAELAAGRSEHVRVPGRVLVVAAAFNSPLRIPIGAASRSILAARRAAPDTVPFIPGRPAPAAASGAQA
jgi:hypothetical protein